MSRIKISLQAALISINLLILLLPIAGIQLLRLYESALVRQTESSLIAQGAFVGAFYRSIIEREGTQNFAVLSKEIEHPDARLNEGDWYPRPPTLDLTSSPILPPLPDPIKVDGDEAQTSEAQHLGEFLNPTLKDAQLTTLAGIRVVDVEGTIIASTGSDLGHSLAATDEISHALTGTSVSRIRTKQEVITATALDSLSRTSRIRVFVSLPIILHNRLVGAVLLSRTPPSIVQAFYAKRHLLLGAAAMLVLLVFTMSILTYRLISRPMNRLVKYAEQVPEHASDAANRLIHRQPPRLRELARLQNAIVDMAHTLENRADYLRAFTQHVSHEFKTPLTSIHGAIELLEDHRHTMDDDQFERFVTNIKSDTTRLTKLTERLNELTQAEMRILELGPVKLDDLITDIAQQFPTTTITHHNLAEFSAPVDAAAFATVLETLISNAEQHAATTMDIYWEDECLNVENDGTPISAGNRALLFTPFFTTRRDAGGAGLGLTIAQTILGRMGAELSIDDDDAITRFLIKFTPAP